MGILQVSTTEVLLYSTQAPTLVLGVTETFLNSCSCHSARSSERTATPQPSRNEECHFPGLLCSVSHTHICISSQLVSTLPVLFACLAPGVAPRTFCSPLLSPRRKVDHSDPNESPNANWQVVRVKGGWWLPGWWHPLVTQGIRAPDWHPQLQLETINNSQNPGWWTLLSLPTILESSQSDLNTNLKEISQKPHSV